MYTKWTSHLQDPEQKTDFERSVLGAKPVLNRLKDLLSEEEKSLQTYEQSPKAFDRANWDYRQAYNYGYLACLNVAKKLVDLDQQKTEMTNVR